MAFSQASIQDVSAVPEGADLRVSWSSTSTTGTTYQVYIDLALAWHGTEKFAVLPVPGPRRIDVGTVGPGEGTVNFAATLPALASSSNRVALTWDGGSYERTKLPVAGFHVYASAAPGAAVNYAAILATVPVATQGVEQGGWGQGGWGQGGWGSGLSHYSWTSGRLCPGAWQFAIRPFDVAGNEGPAMTATATIASAPPPPAANASGKRLTYDTFHITGGNAFATLRWLASPACS